VKLAFKQEFDLMKTQEKSNVSLKMAEIVFGERTVTEYVTRSKLAEKPKLH
jgi:hypothetical protein